MRDQAFLEQMKGWRQYLHAHPETAFEERETAAFVAEQLTGMGLEFHTGVGGTGVVASLKVGDGKEVIGLRADMDAINLPEKGELPYRSQTPGKMHACGHDGHTTILLGAAKFLSERRNFNGTVRFLFQPAEEPGKGARAMLEDGLLERFPMDEIYGLHNQPQFPAGTIYTRTGGIMASEDNFTIRIGGRGAHASAPHLAIDPLVISAQVILGLQTIVSRKVNPLDSAVISCTELHTDGAHNAIPSNVVITGDTRSYSPQMQALLEEQMRAVCENTCAMGGAACEFLYTHEFAPTVNWESCVSTAVQAARNLVGDDKVDANCQPLMGSEDFGLFLQKIPGCFVFLGSGAPDGGSLPLHNACYDFNDSILETGAEFFAELIRLRLPR